MSPIQEKEMSLRQHAMLLGTVDFDRVRYPRGQRAHKRDPARGTVSASRIRNHIYYNTAIACGVYEHSTAPTYYQAAVNAAWPYGKLEGTEDITPACIEVAYTASAVPDPAVIQKIMDILEGNEPVPVPAPDTPF
jgi:hypothetical protein